MLRKEISVDSISLSSILGVYAKGACGEFGFEDLVVIWMGNKYIVLLLNLYGKKIFIGIIHWLVCMQRVGTWIVLRFLAHYFF